MEEKYTKEELNAIVKFNRLYELDKDVNLAWSLFQDKLRENKINLCHLERTNVVFSSSVPSLFLSFVEAIEKGNLIFKEDVK